MTQSALDHAIELLREAQRLVESDHSVIAAHLETVIGLAADRSVALGSPRRVGDRG